MPKTTITCPKCAARYSVDETDLSRSGHCKRCHTVFELGAAAREDGDLGKSAAEYTEDTVLRSAARFSNEDDVPELWNVGDLILDVYEVKRIDDDEKSEHHYAEGGMGVVYRVHHRGWDLDLAVKSPKPKSLKTERGKRNFESECEAWIGLGLHPNTLTCYYVRRLGGIPRVFAEFVGGGNLWDWIRTRRLYQGGPAKALPRILDIAIQFAWGLGHAHDHGLVHQDVKPGNVMMQGEVPKVTDFGLAKAQIEAVRADTDPGGTDSSMLVSWGGMTPAFCSPEQIEAAVQIDSGVPIQQRTKLNRRTDIWSWALTVFAMFCGKAPCRYGGHTAAEVFDAYLEHPGDEDFLPQLPDGVADLIKRCFRREPEARPRSMRQTAAELMDVYGQVTGDGYPRQEPVVAELRSNSLNNRAASLLDLGKQEEAAELLEEAWQGHPWQPQVTHNRGLLRWRMGRSTDLDLISQLEELCKTRPLDWGAAYSLGVVQLERGEAKGALEALEQASSLGGGYEVQATLEQARSILSNTMRCVRSFTGQPPYVTNVFLCKEDNRWILSGIDNHRLRMWDTNSGRTALAFEAPTKGPVYSSDGRWVLAGGENQTLLLTDNSIGRKHVFHRLAWGASPESDFLSLNDRWIVSPGGQHSFELRLAASGDLLRTFSGHTGRVNSIFFSEEGRWALSGSSDNTLRLWDTATGRCIRTLKGHTDPVTSVYLSRNGHWALSASTGRTLRLWNLELICAADRRFTAPLVLSTVTSSEEAGRTQARFADLTSRAHHALDEDRHGDALDLIREARSIPQYAIAAELLDLWASVGSHSIKKKVRDAWCLRTFEGHNGEVRSVCLNADAKWALSASGDGTLRLWDVDTGRPHLTLEGHADWVRSASFSADGKLVLSGSWDKSLRLWDTATGQCLRTFQGHTNCVNSVAISGDGCLGYSGSWDKSIRLWDLTSGECLNTFQGHENYVNSVFLGRDGRLLLSGSEDKTLKLWDTSSGRCLRTFQGHADWVQSVCLEPDGSRAISASKDRTLRLWDVSTGNCLAQLEGHSGPVASACFSGDGRWALSGGKDGTMRLWELETGRCQHVFQGHSGTVASVYLSPDGRWALSGGEDHSLRLWELDWDYEFPGWADWDERARPYLNIFLTLHSPYADDGVSRVPKPNWNDAQFEQLISELKHRGLGWLRPEGVRRELEK